MNKLTIIPHTEKYNSLIDSTTRISYTYLHGKLEQDAEYDIFGFKEIVDVNKEGIFECTYEGKECVFYVWFTGITLIDSDTQEQFKRMAGLCVYSDDIESSLYAMQCYITKVKSL